MLLDLGISEEDAYRASLFYGFGRHCVHACGSPRVNAASGDRKQVLETSAKGAYEKRLVSGI